VVRIWEKGRLGLVQGGEERERAATAAAAHQMSREPSKYSLASAPADQPPKTSSRLSTVAAVAANGNLKPGLRASSACRSHRSDRPPRSVGSPCSLEPLLPLLKQLARLTSEGGSESVRNVSVDEQADEDGDARR
jgi:hypothetical protein